jgi:hypothetical protein
MVAAEFDKLEALKYLVEEANADVHLVNNVSLSISYSHSFLFLTILSCLEWDHSLVASCIQWTQRHSSIFAPTLQSQYQS